MPATDPESHSLHYNRVPVSVGGLKLLALSFHTLGEMRSAGDIPS